MSKQHTPTPWKAATDMDGRHQRFSILTIHPDFDMEDGKEPYHPLIAYSCHGKGHADIETARANAALIVKAVNAHDDLVAHLSGLVNTVLSNTPFEQEMREAIGNTNYQILMDRVKDAGEFLATAKGE